MLKSSINEKEVIQYNGIEIESIKKRKGFTYKVENTLKEYLKKECLTDGKNDI